jgi:hypothetical protein
LLVMFMALPPTAITNLAASFEGKLAASGDQLGLLSLSAVVLRSRRIGRWYMGHSSRAGTVMHHHGKLVHCLRAANNR